MISFRSIEHLLTEFHHFSPNIAAEFDRNQILCHSVVDDLGLSRDLVSMFAKLYSFR